MPKAVKKQQAQATHTAPFNVAAQRLGKALHAAVTHPGCPGDVKDAIAELDTRVFNHHPDVEISLRHGFALRLAGMLNKQRA